MTSNSRASSITLDSYQLLERIGEGGSAHVHRAMDANGRLVAIKLLAPQAFQDQEDESSARARFEREIAALGSLSHGCVLPLLDSGFDEEMGPYLVTPLITGHTLRERFAGLRLCPEAVWLVLESVAQALVAIHEVGLVHRDLKPENLMARPDGHVVLCDLGLAYQAGQTRYTDEGAVVGSVPYMSPEQLEGRDVSPAMDMWATGILAYEWVAGRRPFARDRVADEVAAVLVGSFSPLSAVDRRTPPMLDALVQACLHREASARPTAAQLLARCRQAIDWADLDELASERAALVADPAGYQARVRDFRVGRLILEARAESDSGNAFAALRLIDRALAYAPEDARLMELAAEATAMAPAPSSELAHAETAVHVGSSPSARPSIQGAVGSAPNRTGLWVAAGATALIVAAALVLMATRGDGGSPARTGTSAESSSAGLSAMSGRTGDNRADDGMLQLASDFIGVFRDGIRASEAGERDKALATANPVEPTGGPGAFRDIAPLPLDSLSNNDPPSASGLVAKAGEPLVPIELLGGVEPEKAIADFDRKVAGSPGNAEWGVGRALVYLAAGKTGAGLQQLDGLSVAHSDSGVVWAARGFVALRLGKNSEAEVALGRAIELSGGSATAAEALRNRGILRSRLGRTRDAYMDLVRALDITPGDLQARRELAGIFRGAGRDNDARRLLEAAP